MMECCLIWSFQWTYSNDFMYVHFEIDDTHIMHQRLKLFKNVNISTKKTKTNYWKFLDDTRFILYLDGSLQNIFTGITKNKNPHIQKTRRSTNFVTIFHSSKKANECFVRHGMKTRISIDMNRCVGASVFSNLS